MPKKNGKFKKDKIIDTIRFSLPAKPRFVSILIDFVRIIFKDEAIAPAVLEDIILSIDEAFTNVIMHASPASGNPADLVCVDIRIDMTKNGVYFIISDPGKKWNFAAVPEPEMPPLSSSSKKGGFGIYIIRRLMDKVDFSREDEKNELMLYKSFDI